MVCFWLFFNPSHPGSNQQFSDSMLSYPRQTVKRVCSGAHGFKQKFTGTHPPAGFAEITRPPGQVASLFTTFQAQPCWKFPNSQLTTITSPNPQLINTASPKPPAGIFVVPRSPFRSLTKHGKVAVIPTCGRKNNTHSRRFRRNHQAASSKSTASKTLCTNPTLREVPHRQPCQVFFKGAMRNLSAHHHRHQSLPQGSSLCHDHHFGA